MKLSSKLLIVTAFAIAMGFLESAVVVYLRALLYPGGFTFPLAPIPGDLAVTEILREAATLVMLLTIGMLSARRFSTRFAWFLYTFAIWDIFYYVFLWALLGWPESLGTWDILFLIPTTWTGPVWSPVLVSLTMIGFALLILTRAERGEESRISGRVWAGLIAGALVLILGWILDYSQYMLDETTLGHMFQMGDVAMMEHAMAYVPRRFPWPVFALGEGVILIAIAGYAGWLSRQKKR
ncbi:MAG: hypothetical protein R2751_15795 [Bacteroidales bacterium]